MSEPTPPHAPAASDCLDAAALDAIVDGAAPSAPQEEHLNRCADCRARLQELRDADTFLHRFRRAVVSADDVASVRASEPLPADLIPGYRLVEEISRGSQGVVFKAVQDRTRRTVAIKMLLHGVFATDKQRARFEREVEIVAGLNHPGIVTMYDSTPVRGGRYAYAMQYFEHSIPLDQWSRTLVGDPRTLICARLALFVRVCDAIHYAHQRGVIHRDLKPGNILVDAHDQPHVLDFGIAKATIGPGDGCTVTGEVACTPAYAAPEQMLGRADGVDIRADIYSLGVILFEMLTQRLPHDLEGKPLAQTARAIAEDEAIRLSDIDRTLRGDLDTIVAKALERDKTRRYQSVGLLQQDIRHFLAGEAIEARRDSTFYVLGKAIRRRWRATSVLAALLAIGFITALVVRDAQIGARQANQKLAEARRRVDEESIRAEAVSLMLRETLPPRRIAIDDPTARHSSDGLSKLRGRVELGYMADAPAAEWATHLMLAQALRIRGSTQYAETSLRQAVHIAARQNGLDDPSVATALHLLADVLFERHKLTEAESYCRRAIDIDLHTFESDALAVRSGRELLARILLAQGRTDEAEPIARTLCDAPVGSSSLEQLHYSRALLTWSASLTAQNRHEAAVGAAIRAVSIRLSFLPYNDQDLGDSLEVLAAAIESTGSLTGCEAVAQALHTTDSTSTAAALRRISETLGARYVDASRIAESSGSVTSDALAQLIELTTALLGPDNLPSGRMYAELGVRLQEAIETDRAEAAFRKSVAVYRKHHSPQSHVLANALERMFEVLSMQGELDEATTFALEAYEIWRAQPAHSLESFGAWSIGREAGKCLLMRGRYREAEHLARTIIEEMEPVLGPSQYSVGTMLTIRGAALSQFGDPAEAEEIARRGYTLLTQHPGTPIDQRIYGGAFYAVTLVRQNKLDEAEKLLLTCWEFRNTWYTRYSDPLIAFTARTLATLCEQRGDTDAAMNWLQQFASATEVE